MCGSHEPQRVTLEFHTDGRLRGLLVETQPPGAPLRLEVRSNAAAVPAGTILVGPEGRSLGELGGVVDAGRAKVTPDQAQALRTKADDRVRVWYLASAETAGTDPESARSLGSALRALEYIE